MAIWDGMLTDVKGIIAEGQQIRLRHYTGSVSVTEWDDAQTLTKSGNDVWTSGLMFPVKSTFGSQEAILLEQGKIKTSDKKMFIAGDIETTDTMKIGIGNPVATEYSLIPEGVLAYPPEGTIVYKKMFLRNLPAGSLYGE